MRDISLATRALAAAALLLPALSCGPKVVVARLATPTAGVSAPAATPTPRPKPRTEIPTPPSTATPTPGARSFPAPRLSATATATRPVPSPTATATATATLPAPPPTATATATAPPARPAPSDAATATPLPSGGQKPLPSRSPAAAAPSGNPPATITGAPAVSFAGEWEFRADAGAGVIAGTLRFRLTPEGLAGVYVGMRGNATELSNLRTAVNRISFDLVAPRAVWHLEGTLSGDSIEGTFQTAERTILWTAARKPAS
jgi:hypothetical protein